jgi:hypothetical protein
MPLNPSGAISLGGPTVGQSIAVELGLSPTATISLNQTDVRTLAQVPSGTIIMPTNFYGKSNFVPTQRAIMGFGVAQTPTTFPFLSSTNLISNTGIVAGDTPGVGSARIELAAAGYGGDRAIFGFGRVPSPPAPARSNITNLVSNTGVVATNTPGVGTARDELIATGYGADLALFGFGRNPALPNPSIVSAINRVSNTGVVSADTPTFTMTRTRFAAARYGGDRAIISFGSLPTNTSFLISNTGVVASEIPAAGTGRLDGAAAGYGGDRAIFGFGRTFPSPPSATMSSITNLVSNTGVVASDTPGVGTARTDLAAAGYGGDRAIFGFGGTFIGSTITSLATTNLVSNTGVVASNTPGVGTGRVGLAGAGFSFT